MRRKVFEKKFRDLQARRGYDRNAFVLVSGVGFMIYANDYEINTSDTRYIHLLFNQNFIGEVALSTIKEVD